MFPRADFPWVCRLRAADRTLELWEHYELVQKLHFDEQGRGEPCACPAFWNLALDFPVAWPQDKPPPPPTELRKAVVHALREAFSSPLAAPLVAAPREHAETVAPVLLDGIELWLPDAAVSDAGSIALRDAEGVVGLLDLSRCVPATAVQQLLGHAYPDMDVRVLEDFTTYRAMRVVKRVTLPELQCTLDEAHEVDADAVIGGEVFWPLPLSWATELLHWLSKPKVQLSASAISA